MENHTQTTMPDNQITGVADEQELKYWTNEFGISRDELIKAAKAGKTLAEAVEKYVQKLQFAV